MENDCKTVDGAVADAEPETLATPTAMGFWLLVTLLALVAVGKVALGDNLDPDAFWHMRVGEELLHRGWPGPLVDDLSFASRHEAWTPYSWLAEIGMKKLWDVGGIWAAVMAQAWMEAAFIYFLALGAVNATADRNGPRYLASAMATSAGALLSLAYLSYRPVTAALVLLAAVVWLICRDRRMGGRSRVVWMVPIITALLINIHFFALMVPLWTGALLVGDVISSAGARRLKRGTVLVVLSIIACCLTPMLRGTLRSMWDYSAHDVMVHGGHIVEMHPFYEGVMGSISAAIVAALVAFVVMDLVRWRREGGTPRVGLGMFICLAGGAVLLFQMGRMAPVFAIIAMPIFAATMPKLSDQVLARKPIVIAMALCIVMMLVPIAKAMPKQGQSADAWLQRQGPSCSGYPCKAAEFIEKYAALPHARVICEFSWGGYLEWRLGPRYQTLMDGRTQVFSADFWRSTVLGPRDKQKAYLAGTEADVACVDSRKSAYGDMLTELGWKTVYHDGFARVMTPPGSDAQARGW
jgi:hypothetical protein